MLVQDEGAWRAHIDAATFTSCTDYKAGDWGESPEPVSGVYWIYTSDEETRIKEYCDMDTNGGGWSLVVNLNPSDGHIHGYDHGNWETLTAWTDSSIDHPLTQDYKSETAYDMEVNEIMIVNHLDGSLNAFKSWRFMSTTSFYDAVRIENSVSTGPVEQSGTSTTVPNCPIMSMAGSLSFSDITGNDGVRVGVTGGNAENNVAKGLGVTVDRGNTQCQADSYGNHLCS